MKAEIENVKSGQVTYAVRDTIINEKEIKRGETIWESATVALFLSAKTVMRP